MARLIPSLLLALWPTAWLTPVAADAATPDPRRAEREALVDAIAAEGRRHGSLLPTGFSPAVLSALRAVPRHELVPVSQRPFAYHDRPLPIGAGQTISQPSLVALMTELTRATRGARVLEVGTGSGYQAAILAALGAEVYSIEIVAPLAARAAADLARLGYGRIQLRTGDGYAGWPEAAPFDAIIVTAAAPHVPPPLLAQLKPGGRLVIPVDTAGDHQMLALIDKRTDGSTQRQDVLPVLFVPLTGAAR